MSEPYRAPGDDLRHTILKAWHERSSEMTSKLVPGSSEITKLELLVLGEFRGLKDAIALIADDIQTIRVRVEKQFPIEDN